MKPTTKEQKRIQELTEKDSRFDKTPIRVLSYAERQQFKLYRIDKEHGWCGWCGNEYRVTEIAKPDVFKRGLRVECPYCGKTLKGEYNNVKKDSCRITENVLTTMGEYQVVRSYFVDIIARYGKMRVIDATEVQRCYISQKGSTTYWARRMNTNGWRERYNLGSELELRKSMTMDVNEEVGPIVAAKYTPTLERNGMKLYKGEQPIFCAMSLLLRPHAETVVKSGNYKLLDIGCTENLWQEIKIAIRNGYIIDEPRIWRDYIRGERELGHDTLKREVVNPDGVKERHQKQIKLIERKRRKAIEENERMAQLARIERAERERENYIGRLGMLFGIEWTDELGISYRVLQFDEFATEGEQMHNCVFVCEYYKRSESVIITGRKGGKPYVDIEMELATGRIRQCYAVCNKVPKERDDIMKSVEDNYWRFRKAMKQNAYVGQDRTSHDSDAV